MKKTQKTRDKNEQGLQELELCCQASRDMGRALNSRTATDAKIRQIENSMEYKFFCKMLAASEKVITGGNKNIGLHDADIISCKCTENGKGKPKYQVELCCEALTYDEGRERDEKTRLLISFRSDKRPGDLEGRQIYDLVLGADEKSLLLTSWSFKKNNEFNKYLCAIEGLKVENLGLVAVARPGVRLAGHKSP